MHEKTLIRLLNAARSTKDEILILRRQNWSYRAIKQALEVSMGTISKAVKEERVA